MGSENDGFYWVRKNEIIRVVVKRAIGSGHEEREMGMNG